MFKGKSLVLSLFIVVFTLTGCNHDEDETIEETVIIDFDPPTLPGGSRCENSPFDRSGYTFTPIANCAYAINNADGTGNTYLQTLGNGAGSSLKAASGNTFTVYQLDVAEYSTVYNSPYTVQITCIKDGNPVYVNINLDGVITDSNDMFETFSLENECSNITEMWFDALMSIDNIELTKIN